MDDVTLIDKTTNTMTEGLTNIAEASLEKADNDKNGDSSTRTQKRGNNRDS